MSIEAIAWALKQKTGSPACKGVLVALANYADEDGKCWPKQETIADMTELGERTVRRCLVELEERGLITRQDRFREGKRMSDLFTLSLNPPATVAAGEIANSRETPPANLAAGSDDDPPATLTAGPAATVTETTGQICTKPPARVAAKPSYEPSKNHLLGRAGARKKVGIDEFRMDEEALRIARRFNLTDSDIDECEVRFRAYNAATNPQTYSQWHVHWMTWCGKAAGRLGRIMKGETPADPEKLKGMFYAKAGTPQLEAWQKHTGKTPTDRAGGWLYPSEWPPDIAPRAGPDRGSAAERRREYEGA